MKYLNFVMSHGNRYVAKVANENCVGLHLGYPIIDYQWFSDDKGDNISNKNFLYSELTGLYWVWKNLNLFPDLEYVGFSHYRRVLLNDDLKMFEEKEVETLLINNDFILPLKYNFNWSCRQVFEATSQQSLNSFIDYCEDKDLLLERLEDNKGHYCNIFITKVEIFKKYCEYIFNIFFKMETDEQGIFTRCFGYYSEFLLDVFIKKYNYVYKETNIYNEFGVNEVDIILK